VTLAAKQGDLVAWQFRVKEYDIGFEVTFEPKAGTAGKKVVFDTMYFHRYAPAPSSSRADYLHRKWSAYLSVTPPLTK
jgi:hypothetical protein